MHLKLPSYSIVSALSGVFQGVPVFFIISGFLIWKSIENTDCWKDYLRKRVLRLYPELWCAVLLSIISIVLMYDDIQIDELFLFTIGQATVFQFWTPDSLRGFGCGTPNGSLWTILVIVQFYFAAWWLKKKVFKSKHLGKCLAILAVSVLIGLLSPRIGELFPNLLFKLYNQTIFPYFWIFFTGAACCEYYQNLFPIFKKYWVISLIGLSAICVSGIDIRGNYGLLQTLLQAITWIGFAYSVPKANIKYDVSYGIYLYHMVVINVLIQCGAIGSYVWLALAAVITIMLAVLSYRIVVKCRLIRRI